MPGKERFQFGLSPRQPNPMLKLIFSNHYETLEADLLDHLGQPGDPFAAQQIIVPSIGLRRKLDLAHADRYGISAQLNFQYLAQWLWGQIGCFVRVPQISPFSPELLTWRVYRLLSEPDFVPTGRLATYLNKADPAMRYELAQRTAALFDQYLTYRPQWLSDWSEGRKTDLGSTASDALDDETWQAALWQAVTKELGLCPFHPAGAFFEETAQLAASDPRIDRLPRQAFLFCLPTLPRLYVQLLEKLSRWIDLRVYLLNPCRQYWFEIVDAKRLSYLGLQARDDHHETGNALLAAWGKQTQAQIDLLLGETGAETLLDDSGFQHNSSTSLLATLQNAILDMEPMPSFSLDESDHSLEIHNCHTLSRQLEVLHDLLLDLFQNAAPPAAAEVLVVTPRLAEAAPLIDAVFGATPPERRIPYTITGRPANQENPIARILLELLALPQSRFTASEVFELLREPVVALRFGLATADLEQVRLWLAQSGIRWGMDAQHRADCELPPSARHTFSEGLRRLFLGYALPDHAENLVGGVLPCAGVEGVQARLLGCLWLFVETLERLRLDLSPARSPEDWQRTLLAVIDDFFYTDNEQSEALGEIRSAISSLTLQMQRGGGELTVASAIMRQALADAFDDPTRGGVASGRVTFAALSSLRGLPYQIVCFLGMDDGSFPSPMPRNEFDLMAKTPPQRGDRQRRLDERNLFLDLLLAARQRVIITYTGRSVRDNASLPPSVLVDELLDHLAPALATECVPGMALENARRRLVVEHPLQPFSPRYFRLDPRLFSFNQEYCEAAQRHQSGPAIAMPNTEESFEEKVESAEMQSRFLPNDSPLLPMPELLGEIDLDRLLRFFRHPCRFLLQAGLGISLAKAEVSLLDEEPLVLDWEGRRQLDDRLLPRLLRGDSIDTIEVLAANDPELPEGKLGERLRRKELNRLHDFAERVRLALANASPDPAMLSNQIDLEGEVWHLHGRLDHLTPTGQLLFRCDKTRSVDYLTAWIRHLALCLTRPDGVEPFTRWLSTDGEFVFAPVEEPARLLGELLALYRLGLCRPLHFFPRSSWELAISGSLKKARNTSWAGSIHAESDDPWYRLAFRGVDDPLDEDFEAVTAAVFAPLLEHLEDSRVDRTGVA